MVRKYIRCLSLLGVLIEYRPDAWFYLFSDLEGFCCSSPVGSMKSSELADSG